MSRPESSAPLRGDVLLEEVHVWMASAAVDATSGTLDRLRACLSDDELARHRRYLRDEDRTLFLLARGLLRHTLSRYAPPAPADWRFQAGRFGRPELAPPVGDLGIRFNVSHTRGLAVCAVTRNLAIGVDVETAHRAVDPLRVARHAFAPEEREELEGLPETARLERFLQLWTLKEAYAKARGLGLRLPLRSVRFDLAESEPRAHFLPPVDDDPEAWQFLRWRPAPGYHGALALRPGGDTRRRAVFLSGMPF